MVGEFLGSRRAGVLFFCSGLVAAGSTAVFELVLVVVLVVLVVLLRKGMRARKNQTRKNQTRKTTMTMTRGVLSRRRGYCGGRSR